jgi:hypothetical protein
MGYRTYMTPSRTPCQPRRSPQTTVPEQTAIVCPELLEEIRLLRESLAAYRKLVDRIVFERVA